MQKLDCIVLIDDDEVTNFVHESVIEEAEVAEGIWVAENGQAALELIERRAAEQGGCPNLIFLDINMPVMNGFEFLRAYEKIKDEFTSPVVIVMLTSSLNPDDVARARRAGVTEFLDKPLTADKLRGIVSKHFASA